MVVCRCRKATKVYCFVHKAPVCADCICFPEHRLCVVRTYSEWVVDGDYDWPPKCAACQAVIQDGDSSTTRLGCLHNLHTSCLQSHLESFPPHTAPAGYGCPACPTPVWPPDKYFKESESALYYSLKEAVTQVSVAKVLLGANAPAAFSSGTLAKIATSVDEVPKGNGPATDCYHVDVLPTESGTQEPGIKSPAGASTSVKIIISPDSGFSKPASTTPSQPGATARKPTIRVDRSYVGNHVDNDGGYDESQKYSKRGPSYRQIVKNMPFFSTELPTLPTTQDGDDAIDDRRRRRYRSSAMDVRKLILLLAIMSCMATAMLLYYRLSQGPGFADEGESDE